MKSPQKLMMCTSVSLKGRYKFILTVLLSDDLFFDIDGDCLMVSLDDDDYAIVKDATINYIDNVDIDNANKDSLIEGCLNMTEWFEECMTGRISEEKKILQNIIYLLGRCFLLQELNVKGYRMVVNN